MEPEVAFGKVLRALRQKSGKTQESLAFDAELQRHYVSMLERGKNSPSLKTIFRLADALDVSPEHIIALVSGEMRE